jgi:ATP-dependent helicase HepA
VAIRDKAVARATGALQADVQRLVDLRHLNGHVRAEEIQLARDQLVQMTGAIREARLRLDALRLVVAGPGRSG